MLRTTAYLSPATFRSALRAAQKKSDIPSAWEQYFREGKANEVTGRFFRPRVSEEF